MVFQLPSLKAIKLLANTRCAAIALLCPFHFFFSTGATLAGRFNQVAAKAVHEIYFKLAALPAGSKVGTLAGKIAKAGKFKRMKNIAYRSFNCALAFDDLLLYATIYTAQCTGFNSALINSWGVVKTR